MKLKLLIFISVLLFTFAISLDFVHAYRTDKATIHDFEDVINITGFNLTTSLAVYPVKELTKSLMINYTAGSQGLVNITTKDIDFSYANRTNLWVYGDNSNANFTIKISLTTGESYTSNTTIVNWTGWNKITKYITEFESESTGLYDLYNNLDNINDVRLYLENTTDDTNSLIYIDDLNFKPLKVMLKDDGFLIDKFANPNCFNSPDPYCYFDMDFTGFSNFGILVTAYDIKDAGSTLDIQFFQGTTRFSNDQKVRIDYKESDSRRMEFPLSRYVYSGEGPEIPFNFSELDKIRFKIEDRSNLEITLDEIYLSIPENNDPFTIQNEIHRLNNLIYALDLINDINSELNSELTKAQELNTTANQIANNSTTIDFNLNITGVQELKLRKSDITANLETLNKDIKQTIARLINISHANNNSFRNATNIIFEDAVSEKSIFKIEEFDDQLNKFGEAYKQYTNNGLGRYWNDISRENSFQGYGGAFNDFYELNFQNDVIYTANYSNLANFSFVQPTTGYFINNENEHPFVIYFNLTETPKSNFLLTLDLITTGPGLPINYKILVNNKEYNYELLESFSPYDRYDYYMNDVRYPYEDPADDPNGADFLSKFYRLSPKYMPYLMEEKIIKVPISKNDLNLTNNNITLKLDGFSNFVIYDALELKEDLTTNSYPSLEIITPDKNTVGNNFNLSVYAYDEDGIINATYSINNGNEINITLLNNDYDNYYNTTIDPSGWTENTNYTLTVYTQDQNNKISATNLTLNKNTTNPVVTINSPISNQQLDTYFNLDIDVIENNIERVYYTVDNGQEINISPITWNDENYLHPNWNKDYPYSGRKLTLENLGSWYGSDYSTIVSPLSGANGSSHTISVYVEDELGLIGSSTINVIKTDPILLTTDNKNKVTYFSQEIDYVNTYLSLDLLGLVNAKLSEADKYGADTIEIMYETDNLIPDGLASNENELYALLKSIKDAGYNTHLFYSAMDIPTTADSFRFHKDLLDKYSNVTDIISIEGTYNFIGDKKEALRAIANLSASYNVSYYHYYGDFIDRIIKPETLRELGIDLEKEAKKVTKKKLDEKVA